MFSMAIVGKIALAGSSLMQLALLRQTVITMDAALANDYRQRVVSLSGTAIALASLVVFFVWLFRSKKRLIAAGMAGAEYSPGFSVGCFFIPIVNLFLPFQAVRELWRASQCPTEWKSQSSSQIVGWWWALWLLSAFVPLAGMLFQSLVEGREKMIVSTQVLIASAIVSILSFLLTILFARGVAKNSQGIGTKAEPGATDNPGDAQ